jgi:hypothetical protein
MSPRILAALGALALAACVSGDAPAPDLGDETALLGDEDLDNARPIPIDEARSFRAQPATVDLAVPAIAVPTRDSLRPGSGPAAIRGRAEALEPEGKLAYVQSIQIGPFAHYWLRLATVRDFQLPAKLIYQGSRAIDSVAVSADAQIVTFAAENAAGDFDAFLLDLGGLFGKKNEVYLLPSTGGDELSVSMSLDGETHAWQSFDAASGTTNYIVAFLDRATGGLAIQPFNITLGGIPIEQIQPSLTGNGADVYFVSADETIFTFFGAPVLIRFASDGSSGAVVFAGIPDLTTELAEPSVSFDGTRFMVREVFAGIEFLEIVAPTLGEFAVVFADRPVQHPYLTADGASFTFAENGAIFKADINVEDPGATEATPLPDLPGLFPASSPYWAKELPPPPPPPPGTIVYEGTTADGPTFNRPDPLGPDTVGPVNYHAFSFTSEEAGFYTFVSEQDYDGFLHLYAAPFEPEQPLVNLLAGNDDLEDNRHSGFRTLLEANTDYVLVTSAWAPGDAGNFTNTISPPEIPAPGEAPVIEVLAESVRVTNPGQTIGYEFFVASSDPIACEIDFGDGNVEAIACEPNTFVQASHAFAADGFYTVVVTATSDGGSDQAKAFPTIHTDDPTSFDIVVVFGNDLLSPSQRAAFQTAADRWAEIITGDLAGAVSGGPEVPTDFVCGGAPPFNGSIDDLVISAVGEPIDGPGAVLGSAGPCLVRADGTNGNRFPLPLYGAMRFDIADLGDLESSGSLEAVILHEMGHVIGIGTLWRANNFLTGTESQGADPNDPSYDPRYHGPQGVAAYNVLRDDAGLPADTSVPVANTGGGGTRESHWREITFVNELMTGFLGAGDNPLSIQTIGDLDDLGYDVDYVAADPYALPAGTPFMRAPAHGHDTVWSIEDVKR